ncbi:hypothetical protein B0H13DRAFT_2060349 [Mycena leptocephala]|nr:hypothetical protein B0H13DRAFT_2060349 [Mycena leptocephala]
MKLQDAEHYIQPRWSRRVSSSPAIIRTSPQSTQRVLSGCRSHSWRRKRSSRIVVKRVDHIERAHHKEERPPFVQDYDQQQATDRRTFAASLTVRKEAVRPRDKEAARAHDAGLRGAPRGRPHEEG